MLIADDVGVGKTIEGALVASELLERGDAQRMAVLCPPHLCEQWQRELNEKFHLDAKIVRTSTIARLERELPRRDLSIYQHYRCLVISIDYVKGQSHRYQLLTHCPDLVIVDEAHTCARPPGDRGGDQQQRHELVEELSRSANRHLVLLTATPHSGIEESFRSLLGLLRPEFERLDMETMPERDRERLARHFVQRRRADVARWMGADTPFPERVSTDVAYPLSLEYRELFQGVLDYTRERVQDATSGGSRQRVQFWAAVSLIRCVMSSPAAAFRALSNREGSLADDGEVDEEQRRREILDPVTEEGTIDAVPEAALAQGASDLSDRQKRALRGLRQQAEGLLSGKGDLKVAWVVTAIQDLLGQGNRPIIYCRFIPTAHYVAEQLRQRLKGQYQDLQVVSITGEMDDEQRETRVRELAEAPHRVLVATDCLSEGVNLQSHFDAVIHYDLPWNPNRLEQREGRVDRYGQSAKRVQVMLFVGVDNPIDGAVLNVLIRKARSIRDSLGITVPVPEEAQSVMEAVVQSLFLSHHWTKSTQLGFDYAPHVGFHENMERSAERERVSRTRFAQHAIKPEEVARELEAVDSVLGDPTSVQAFTLGAAERVALNHTRQKHCHLIDASSLVAEGLGPDWKRPRRVTFGDHLQEGVEVVGRSHPLVSALSRRVLSAAFQPLGDQHFSRCGASRTDAVCTRTVLLLLRLRYRLTARRGTDQFAEEILASGFRRDNGRLVWFPPGAEEADGLLESAHVTGSLSPQERERQVADALGLLADPNAKGQLLSLVQARATEMEEAHARLRRYTGGGKLTVTAYDPDLLGLYVFLPGSAR
jgi:superfamily II DNA or RNA helicase